VTRASGAFLDNFIGNCRFHSEAHRDASVVLPVHERACVERACLAMETFMFSLKFDLLFPSVSAAKATARLLNRKLRPAPPLNDPRELKRMQDELRLAREELRLRSTVHRNLFL
jgi:hypothetical protein